MDFTRICREVVLKLENILDDLQSESLADLYKTMGLLLFSFYEKRLLLHKATNRRWHV